MKKIFRNIYCISVVFDDLIIFLNFWVDTIFVNYLRFL